MPGIEEPYSSLRNVSRAHIAEIWKLHKAGVSLDAERRILAERLVAHPEWAHYWELADDLGDAEILTPEGVNPFGAVAVEAALEGILGPDGDPVAQETYRQLCQDGLTDKEARDEIARVLLGTLWVAGTGHTEYGPSDFKEALRRLAAGETTDEIFPPEE